MIEHGQIVAFVGVLLVENEVCSFHIKVQDDKKRRRYDRSLSPAALAYTFVSA